MSRLRPFAFALLIAALVLGPGICLATIEQPVVESRGGVDIVGDVPFEKRSAVNINNIDRKIHTSGGGCAKPPCGKGGERRKMFDFIIESDFFSQYVSKGLPCSEGPVWQPSVTIEAYNVGVSVWSNFVLNDEPNQGQFNEVDITPYYNLRIGNFNFIPGVNFLLFPNDNLASLNYSAHNVIRPQWHMSYKIGHFVPYADGFYYPYPPENWGTYHDLGVLFEYRFFDFFKLVSSAQMAIGGAKWNERRITGGGTEVNNLEFVLALIFEGTRDIKGFSASPVMHVVTTVPEDLREQLTQPDYLWGGVMISYDLGF